MGSKKVDSSRLKISRLCYYLMHEKRVDFIGVLVFLLLPFLVEVSNLKPSLFSKLCVIIYYKHLNNINCTLVFNIYMYTTMHRKVHAFQILKANMPFIGQK